MNSKTKRIGQTSRTHFKTARRIPMISPPPMHIIFLIAILLCAGKAPAAECAWNPAFVSAAAKPLPSSRLRGIDRSLPMPAIIDRLGPAARDVGSGLYVLQWEVTDGRIFSVSTASACGTPVNAGFHPPRSDPSLKPKPPRGSS